MREAYAVDYFGKHRRKPCLIIGNGPSASLVQPHQELLRDKFITIGMNRSWKIFDNAHYHVIMFHREHLDDLVKHKYPTNHMTLWTYRDYSEMWVREVNQGSVVYVPSVANPDNPMHQYNLAGLISYDLSECSYADMTGMFALEVALWLRCDPIYLIGYDLYGGHFCDKLRPEDEWQDIQVELFDMCADQIGEASSWNPAIFNCNPESRISGFDKINFEEILS